MTRTCGGCSLCCKLLGVPELKKPAGTCCEFIQLGTKPGDQNIVCTCYETRPQSCRDFECLWLASAAAGFPMPEDMRPDNVWAVFGGSKDGTTSVVYVDPRRPDVWRRGPVARTIRQLRTKFRVIIVCGDQRTLLEPEES